MRPLIGPRIVVEAAFLVAVPVVALVAGVSWYAIVAAGAVAYLAVLGAEWTLWRRAKAALPPPRPVPLAEEVVARPPDRVRVIRPETEPEQAREPEPEVVVAVAAEPEPLPAPAPAPEPKLPPAAAVSSVAGASGRERWNVWDLERLVREHSGEDPIVDEERTFLLMYLRDFAGPDGLLPVDFDDLVRQSFGSLVANR